MPDQPIELLIVDGHEPSRVGLAVLLQRQPWIGRCLLATGEADAARAARRHRPAVALLDISEAWPFVGAATRSLREAHPGIQIVLTSRRQMRLPGTLRELGAAAYVEAPSRAEELVAAVRDALVSPEAATAPAPRPAADQLTPREQELLLLISTGATNREIAARLHLGPDAIKKNASALYRKLGVRNRVEAAKLASSRGAP